MKSIINKICLLLFVQLLFSFNYLYENNWKSGSANTLNDKILTYSIFLSSRQNQWTTNEKDKIISKTEEAQNWLQLQAKNYQQNLYFYNKDIELIDDNEIQKIIFNQEDRIERTKSTFNILKKIGFDKKYSLMNYMFDSTNCKKLQVLIFVKEKGTSYSLPYRIGMNKKQQFIESSILFYQYNSEKEIISSTIAHEMLHLYGAWDLYKTFAQLFDREKKATELFPNSIMLKTYTNLDDNMVDELTAWLIGWSNNEKEWYQWFKPKNM